MLPLQGLLEISSQGKTGSVQIFVFKDPFLSLLCAFRPKKLESSIYPPLSALEAQDSGKDSLLL